MFYDDSLTVELKMEEELNSLFAGSIENHDFQVYLQPKVGLESRVLEGAEAWSAGSIRKGESYIPLTSFRCLNEMEKYVN